MTLFRAKLPISDEDREWIESGFDRLSRALGHHRLRDAEVVLPNDSYFPDPYDGSEASAKALFHRLCSYMKVNPARVEFHVFPDESEELKKLLPSWRGSTPKSCAGLFTNEDDGS